MNREISVRKNAGGNVADVGEVVLDAHVVLRGAERQQVRIAACTGEPDDVGRTTERHLRRIRPRHHFARRHAPDELVGEVKAKIE